MKSREPEVPSFFDLTIPAHVKNTVGLSVLLTGYLSTIVRTLVD